MAVRKRGSSWQADVTFRGERFRYKFLTSAEAHSWHRLAKDAVGEGRRPPIPRGLPGGDFSLGGIIAALAKPGGAWSSDTIKAPEEATARAKEVSAFFGPERDIRTLSRPDVDRFV